MASHKIATLICVELSTTPFAEPKYILYIACAGHAGFKKEEYTTYLGCVFGLARFNNEEYKLYLACLCLGSHALRTKTYIVFSVCLGSHSLMYIWLVCCGSIRRLIISFALKRVMLSLTFKERGIHVYLACLLWQYSSIHNFFQLY